jgi:hypothetical protein
MLRKVLFLVFLLLACYLALSAQPAAQGTAPEVGTTNVSGITVPDIPGAPFSATAVIQVERYWPDGSTQIRRTINLIARDSNGRTHNEFRRLMPEYFHGSPPLMSVRLFDPLTRIRTIYDPALHVATQQLLPRQPRASSFPNPFMRVEDLGTSLLNGLQAKGTRRIYAIAAAASGTGIPLEIEDEDWYSEDLHINLLVRHSDPRIGVQTVGVADLKREEPPAAMFQVPAGFQILDVVPPATEPASPEPMSPKPATGPTP